MDGWVWNLQCCQLCKISKAGNTELKEKRSKNTYFCFFFRTIFSFSFKRTTKIWPCPKVRWAMWSFSRDTSICVKVPHVPRLPHQQCQWPSSNWRPKGKGLSFNVDSHTDSGTYVPTSLSIFHFYSEVHTTNNMHPLFSVSYSRECKYLCRVGNTWIYLILVGRKAGSKGYIKICFSWWWLLQAKYFPHRKLD